MLFIRHIKYTIKIYLICNAIRVDDFNLYNDDFSKKKICAFRDVKMFHVNVMQFRLLNHS